MKVLGIIPSRYASTRFPGKALVDICGKTMVQRVYEQVKAVAGVEMVMVATDDERIVRNVESFGGSVMLTSSNHANGTSRCLEVVEKLEKQSRTFDVVINIQGDEPLIKPEQIGRLIALFQDEKTDIATLIHPIEAADELMNPNVVKVVTGIQKQALYFSRQAIPFVRERKNRKLARKNRCLQTFGYLCLQDVGLEENCFAVAGQAGTGRKPGATPVVGKRLCDKNRYY